MSWSRCKPLMHSNVMIPQEITRKSINIFTLETVLHLYWMFGWKKCWNPHNTAMAALIKCSTQMGNAERKMLTAHWQLLVSPERCPLPVPLLDHLHTDIALSLSMHRRLLTEHNRSTNAQRKNLTSHILSVLRKMQKPAQVRTLRLITASPNQLPLHYVTHSCHYTVIVL